ncbi:DNA polymerase III subunit delta' [Campylobacter rectus]|uniref:DNA polymerase III subunit delta' n=1 Tax=Campylobacter rectus TaxID=203 RepID=UPI0028DCD604|nr:DNA polymerase III subunit delta' [Campylobacter rectus]
MQSKIVITSDFEALKEEILGLYGVNSVRFFFAEDFLLENAKEVAAEAYIAESEPKLLVLGAKNFRVEAQNSLLKIIEEPPKNIFFIIAATSKNMLLPTVRSRLVTENRLIKKQREKTGLNYKRLELKEICAFIDEKSALERSEKLVKNDLKELIAAIALEATAQGVKFSAEELEYFFKAVRLAELNTKTHALLTPILLMIYEKGLR